MKNAARMLNQFPSTINPSDRAEPIRKEIETTDLDGKIIEVLDELLLDFMTQDQLSN